MADQWYYGGGDTRRGPFSDRQLQALAAGGSIRPTDTIWKEGVARGVPADQVKNLFPPGTCSPQASPPALVPPATVPAEPASPPVAEATPPAEGPVPADGAGEAAPEPDAPPPPRKRPPSPPARKGRAVALKGAVITGQDGEIVFFNKKCVVCGNAETGRSRMPIRNGVTRISYFCPKCKRARPVEIQGTT